MNESAPDQVAERAEALFQQGYCCAESVLLALAEAQGLACEWIPRIATGFCGGLGRTGGVCGAVTGAIMGLNLARGRQRPDASPEASHQVVREFLSGFGARFGSITCEQLIGCRLDTPEGRQFFMDHHLREQRCRVLTREAAQLAAVLLCHGAGPTP
jgi:C_GCAxxG_C_C family probable redox protein